MIIFNIIVSSIIVSKIIVSKIIISISTPMTVWEPERRNEMSPLTDSNWLRNAHSFTLAYITLHRFTLHCLRNAHCFTLAYIHLDHITLYCHILNVTLYWL